MFGDLSVTFSSYSFHLIFYSKLNKPSVQHYTNTGTFTRNSVNIKQSQQPVCIMFVFNIFHILNDDSHFNKPFFGVLDMYPILQGTILDLSGRRIPGGNAFQNKIKREGGTAPHLSHRLRHCTLV